MNRNHINAFRFCTVWVLATWLCSALACRPSEMPTSATKKDPARDQAVSAEIDVETIEEKNARPPVPHPLDQVAEGRMYRQAIAAIDEGRLEEADRIRLELKEHPHYSILADAIAGFLLAKAGRSDAAIDVAEAISRVPVMRVESYLLAGQAFHAQGDWGAAIQAFRGAVAEHRDCVRGHRWLGAILYDTGAMWEAVEHLRAVGRLDRRDTRSLRLAGLIHYDYQQYEEAVQDYLRLLKRSLELDLAREVRIELADSFRELRRYAEAMETLVPLDEDAAVLAMQAACYEAAGDLEQALQAAERALALEPRHRQANLVAGRIDHSNRRWDEAIERLRVAVEVDPGSHEPRFLLGRALLQTGELAAGESEIEQATKLRELNLQVAELHLQAIARPGDADLRCQLGQLTEQLGRKKAAATWYRAALGLQSGHTQAAAALKRLTSDG